MHNISVKAANLIGSEIIKLGAEINQKIKEGNHIYNLTIGDFNPKMINIAESLGTHMSRKLSTYRFLFDRTKPFIRHKTI